ncbi:protein of unknown function [Fibrobacter sp. UWEL]|nr:protein of unknown function [Fibrobacter sp. UWEL]
MVRCMGNNMKKQFFSILAGLGLAASVASAAPDPNFHIYLAYGQSNMGGTADAQASDKVEHPRFKIIASQKCSGKGRNTLGEVYPAVPSLFNCGNTISVADWFGRTMADSMPDVTIGIVPVAVGGASIKLFDKDQYASYLSTAESWLQNYAKEYEPSGNVPQAIIDLAKKAQEVGVIKGIIFHQGETDGGYSDWPKIVKKTRDDFLSALGMSSDSVPFVAGELLRTGCCYSDRVSKLSNTMDNTYFASSEGLEGNGVDRYHFGHDAYVTIGKRYAEQMLKAINRAPVVPEPQTPFKGEAASIPGKIEMEDFDIPGVGSGNDSYKENDSKNNGDSDYRKDTGVDLYQKGDKIVVGYNQEGEWLEYTVKVAETGEYNMYASVASANNTSSFKLSMDGKDITESIAVPKNEGENNYDDFSKVTAKVNLTEGEHILRFTVTGSWMDIDYITFALPDDPIDPVPPVDSVETGDGITRGVALNSTALKDYRVFNMMGKVLGSVNVAGGAYETGLKSAGYDKGVYLLQSADGIKQIVRLK